MIDYSTFEQLSSKEKQKKCGTHVPPRKDQIDVGYTHASDLVINRNYVISHEEERWISLAATAPFSTNVAQTSTFQKQAYLRTGIFLHTKSIGF